MPFDWLFIHTEKQYVRLSYLVKPSDATDKGLKWSSSDPSIATVDSNGLVKGVKGGTSDEPCTVTITATAQDGSGKKATCKVTVYKRIWFATEKTEIVDIDYGEGIKVQGIIKSFYNLKSATVGFISIDTETKKETNYWSKEYTVNSNSFDLKDIDNQISFKMLDIGYYRFYVKVVDIYDYEKTLQDDPFLVKIVTVIATQGSIIVYINGETKPEWEFDGSINPTKTENTDGCGTAKIAAGTYIMTWQNDNYRGKYQADCYTVTTLSGSGVIPLKDKRSPFCNEHKETTATGILVHQGPLNAEGTGWSTGCIMVRGKSNGLQEMRRFAKLVGNYKGCSATLIVKR